MKKRNTIKDCPLRTTEKPKQVLTENFSGQAMGGERALVLKGTAVTADSYWKGREDHDNAAAAAEHYQCPDKYAVSDMEELALMNTAACFGLQDRVVSIRVVVNLDTFLKGESPELLWNKDQDYDKKLSEDNSETLDIFRPGMENLFDVGRILIDAALAERL